MQSKNCLQILGYCYLVEGITLENLIQKSRHYKQHTSWQESEYDDFIKATSQKWKLMDRLSNGGRKKRSSEPDQLNDKFYSPITESCFFAPVPAPCFYIEAAITNYKRQECRMNYNLIWIDDLMTSCLHNSFQHAMKACLSIWFWRTGGDWPC